ncbi:hypothetical protein MKW94_015338 [Papaver nudicaule]|uniref:Lysosomal Pro-X carboxypeptidase n=1 Tax=Papaver nudicaule TaxID=74823 RepID=A0AA41S4E1_PAPNU|nr:hypothetical protein [Papaver nudicaule]
MKLFFLSLLFLFSFSTGKRIPHPKFPTPINIQAESILPQRSTKPNLYEIKYFTQVLDHFNYYPQSYQTFQQRYLINYQYWGGAEKNAPIFVYTGNEGDIEWFAQNTGFMFETAPQFKALVVFLEHRYYGKTHPFGDREATADRNSTPPMFGYLSSAQALADYATLIIDLKKNLTAQDSPVIVFGGSYGGMLAAWFRLKYPHIALGALASSAPILGFQGLASPSSFNNIITQDFKGESENCYKVIKESWKLIGETEEKPGGLDLLKKSLKLCDKMAITVENWLTTALTYTAMSDYPTPSNFLNPLPAYPVRQMCKAIDDPAAGNDTFAKIYGAASIYYNSSGTAKCFNLSDFSDPHGAGAWGLQLILRTDGHDEGSMLPPREVTFNEVLTICKDYIGIEPRLNWLTTEFGGMDIKRVLKRFGSNIIFFNGLRDPWSGLGVLKSISKSIVAIVARKGAHHVDLRFSDKEDPKWLQDVRKKEIHIIQKWIDQYYHDLSENLSYS